MSPDRNDLFSKRGATLGVLSVVVATLVIAVLGAALGALLLLVF